MMAGKNQEKGGMSQAGSGSDNHRTSRQRKSFNGGKQRSPNGLAQNYAQHLKMQDEQLKQAQAATQVRKASSGKALIQKKLGTGPPPKAATRQESTPITTASTQITQDEILAQVMNISVSDEGSMRGKVISASWSAAPDEMSQMTDEFAGYYDNRRSYRNGRLSHMIEDNTIQEESSSLPQEQQVLFTFSRGDVHTTLNSKTADEETMEDLVKRLQQKESNLLKFSKEEIRAIKTGRQEVVFLLKQIQGAKFSKEEFGLMKATDIQILTRERPILIEIQTQEVMQGETLDVF